MLNHESEIIFNNNSNELTPNIPQKEALMAIAKMKQQNKNKYLVVLPSGIGKTYLSAFETYDFNGRILYIAHRNEILIQAKDVFKKIHDIDENDIGFYIQKKKQINKKIVFASIQSISRENNLKKIQKDYFDYIILDEWHHVSALSYQRVLQYFKPKYLLGMTATPYRLDGKDILSPVNYNVPYQMELKEGIRLDWLVPFNYYGLWDDVDYSDIKWGCYRYTEKDLDKKLLIDGRDISIIREVKNRIGKRQAIGFCNSVKHVKRCVKKFNDAGFSTNAIYYEIELPQRRKIIDDFKAGKYQIIFTRDIFNEGVDLPEVECLLFLRPTFSKTVFFQQLGRGLRKNKGKKDVLVLDFIGNYTNAYKIRNWLKNIITTGEGVGYFKPEHNHNVAKVHFDSRIIDLFDLQECGSRYSKERLIENYRNLKEKLGRAPTAQDMERYSGISRYPYETWWGSWLAFKQFMKDNVTYYTKEQIKEQYKLFYDEHGRPPSVRDIRKHKLITDNTVRRAFGCGFSKALLEMGFKPKKMAHTDVTREEVIKAYFDIKNKLGKQPRISTSRHGCDLKTYYDWAYHCKLHFGSYYNFLKKMNEPIPKTFMGYEKITKEMLFKNYDVIKKSIKKKYTSNIWHRKIFDEEIPISFLNRKYGSKFDYYWYRKYFGSCKRFREEYKKFKLVGIKQVDTA